MTHPRSPLRALRAALFAVVCVTLAAVGHSSMSAHSVPPASLLAAFAVTTVLAWAAAGRRRGSVAVATGLVGVQGALHMIFGAGEHGGSGGGTAEMPTVVLADPYLAHAAHLAHMAHSGHAMGGATTGPAPDSGAGMLAAHLLAALACGLWLARGEAALFTLTRTAGARARTPLRLLLAAARMRVRLLSPPPRPPARPTRHPRRLPGVVLPHTLSRRGPPPRPVPRATTLGALV